MNKKVCFISSKGGHFAQIKELIKRLENKNFFEKNKKIILTYRKNDISILPETYFIEDITTYLGDYRIIDPLKIIINSLQVLKILLKEKPTVIVSTGAGVAIPTCIIGKILGLKIIYIESFSRIFKPSSSGKIIYHIADLFFVQWEEMKKHYSKSIYAGRLK